jgi:hypothetical protein
VTGGWETTQFPPPPGLTIDYNYAAESQEQWYVLAYNGTGASISLQVEAVCTPGTAS